MASRSAYRPARRVCEMKISPVPLTASSSRSLNASMSGSGRMPRRQRAEAHDAERHRREPLERGIVVNPLTEEPREPHVLRKPRAKPVRAEVANHHP